MSNPYLMVLEGDLLAAALTAAHRLGENKLSDFALELTEHQQLRFEGVAPAKYRCLSTRAEVLCGGLLMMARVAADANGRVPEFKAMYESLGLCRTKAYSLMKVYESLGDDLLTDADLAQQFRLEALKMLSADAAPAAARQEAIEQARRGELITIQRAQELLDQFAEAPPQGAPDPPRAGAKKRRRVGGLKRPAGKPVWKYRGDVVDLVVHAGSERVHVDYESVIRDLEAALEAYRRDYRLEQEGNDDTTGAAPDEPAADESTTDEPDSDDDQQRPDAA